MVIGNRETGIGAPSNSSLWGGSSWQGIKEFAQGVGSRAINDLNKEMLTSAYEAMGVPQNQIDQVSEALDQSPNVEEPQSEAGQAGVEAAAPLVFVIKLRVNPKKVVTDAVTKGAPKKGLGNPFKDKSAKEIDEMFTKKGFEKRGPDPANGTGGYVDPKTGRSYHIDPKDWGKFKEPNHVDVNRLKSYEGSLEKKKLHYKED